MVLRLKCSKRGSVLDFIGLILGVMCLVAGFWFGSIIWDEAKVMPELTASNNTAPIIEAVDPIFTSLADNLIFGLFIGLIIGSMISALLSKANPFFLYMCIIVIIILLIICVPFSLWWDSFSTNEAFGDMVSHYPKTNYIFNHLALLCLLDILMMIICLFIVMRRQGGV